VNNDNFAKAISGRFFPIPATDAISLVREQRFAVYEYNERLSVRFENCAVRHTLGHQLATFFRMNYLVSFSLPESVAAFLARAALLRAIEGFAEIDKEPHLTLRSQQFVVYRAFLGDLGLLTIAYDVVNAGSRSYLAFKSASQLAKPRADDVSLKVIRKYVVT
jgi:hypothetical protein